MAFETVGHVNHYFNIFEDTTSDREPQFTTQVG